MLTLRDCFVIATLLGVSLAMSRAATAEIGLLILFAPGAYATWQFLRRGDWIPNSLARNLIVSFAGAVSSLVLVWLVDWGHRLANPAQNNGPDRMYFGPVLLGFTVWGAIAGGIVGMVADLDVENTSWKGPKNR